MTRFPNCLIVGLFLASISLPFAGGRAATATAPGQEALRESAKRGDLTEREKWRLAREAYNQALREAKKKDTEAAAYYYEVALELLGSLDMASIEVPTQRVLSFQRKVLNSYNQFLTTLDSLPGTAGPVAILESGGTQNEQVEEELVRPEIRVPKPVSPPAPIGKTMLPEVPMTMNSQVASQISFFMNRGRKVMLTWMERSAYVFPRARPILAEEGIPHEVLYLAMIESGLNPRAYSYAHAAGVWQFIPSSGRIYGLNVDRWYDERLHVEASTRAACRYLRKLHDQFGDWYLAFAAYNCGEMRIARELARHKRADYWKILPRLPRQTRSYVPAYLATRAICEHPEQYGFPAMPKETPFECERVWVKGAYHLDHIAQAAGSDATVVRELNPEFLRYVTPDRGPVMVRLPDRPGDDFEAKLKALPPTKLRAPRYHRVRRGETLASIAQRYGTTVPAICALPENRRVKPKKLRAGQQIVIPETPELSSTKVVVASTTLEGVTMSPASEGPGTKTEGTGKPQEIHYTVHRGETLGRISQQLGVSVAEICRQNQIRNPNQISPGQKLRVRLNGSSPKEDVAPASLKPVSERQAPRIHVVKLGETVWSIARIYGQYPHKILSWNKLEVEGTIHPGQELIVSQQE